MVSDLTVLSGFREPPILSRGGALPDGTFVSLLRRSNHLHSLLFGTVPTIFGPNMEVVGLNGDQEDVSMPIGRSGDFHVGVSVDRCLRSEPSAVTSAQGDKSHAACSETRLD